MEQVLTPEQVSIIERPLFILRSTRALLGKMLPLWRHAVWLTAIFVVLSASLAIRLDVQQYRADLDRYARATQQAELTHDQMLLELDSRRRIVAMEQAAIALAMEPGVRIVRMGRAGF